MPEEILTAIKTPQPQPKADRPLDETLEPKPTNWPKVILAAVFGLGLLASAAYGGYWYGMRSANLKSQSAKPTAVPQTTPIPTTSTPKTTPTPTPEPTPTEKTYPSTSNFGFYLIHQIKQEKTSSGDYNTEGYVIRVYTCPPCPKGTFCELCVGDHVIISENNIPIRSDITENELYSNLTDTELIIFARNTQQFNTGTKYKFSIRITNHKRMTFEPINDIELLGYEKIVLGA